MHVKSILSEVKLVIADLQVPLGDQLRSSPTLCALIGEGDEAKVVPLNTPDGRPIFMSMENAIPLKT